MHYGASVNVHSPREAEGGEIGRGIDRKEKESWRNPECLRNSGKGLSSTVEGS